MADTRTRAARNRAIRQDALREQIALGKHHMHLVDSIEEISKADNKLELEKIKLKNEIRTKLMAKYIPDLKSMEYVDNTPQKLTFVFADGATVTPQAIEGSVIDSKAIEYDDKGETKIIEDSVTEKP